jgi:hypothetical protein
MLESLELTNQVSACIQNTMPPKTVKCHHEHGCFATPGISLFIIHLDILLKVYRYYSEL